MAVTSGVDDANEGRWLWSGGGGCVRLYLFIFLVNKIRKT